MGKKNTQNGTSLIEMVVALLILAIGTLGIMGMQVQSMRINQNAHLYSMAAMLANDMFETMYATEESKRKDFEFSSGGSAPTAPSCDYTSCDTDSEVIALFNHEWHESVAELLPGGEAEVEQIGDDFVITISFLQTSLQDDLAITAGPDLTNRTEYVMRASF